jgi:hypothetical protein
MCTPSGVISREMTTPEVGRWMPSSPTEGAVSSPVAGSGKNTFT